MKQSSLLQVLCYHLAFQSVQSSFFLVHQREHFEEEELFSLVPESVLHHPYLELLVLIHINPF